MWFQPHIFTSCTFIIKKKNVIKDFPSNCTDELKSPEESIVIQKPLSLTGDELKV